MNTALFKQATPSLTTVIQRWFQDNPEVLRDGETFKIEIFKYKSKPGVKVTVHGHIPTDLDVILDQSVGVLAQIHPVKIHGSFAQSCFRCNRPGAISPINSIRELVSFSESDLLRRPYMGVKALTYVKEALSKLDPRLFLGMIHKIPE